MSLFWPILWIGSILAAVIAFVVIAMRESASKRAATLAMQPKPMPVDGGQGSLEGSMENLDSFPTDSLNFDEGSLK